MYQSSASADPRLSLLPFLSVIVLFDIILVRLLLVWTGLTVDSVFITFVLISPHSQHTFFRLVHHYHGCFCTCTLRPLFAYMLSIILTINVFNPARSALTTLHFLLISHYRFVFPYRPSHPYSLTSSKSFWWNFIGPFCCFSYISHSTQPLCILQYDRV